MPGLGPPSAADPSAAVEPAAALMRSLPLRMSPPAGVSGDPQERGWIAGLDECRELLEKAVGHQADQGLAFGLPWPYLRCGDLILAPAIPVGVGSAEVQGPDGAYQLDEVRTPGRPPSRAILREAGGACRLLLEFDSTPEHEPWPDRCEPPPDLVWFGPGERLTLVRGQLEVEDLFALMILPASATLLERLLIRQRRLDPLLLEGLEGLYPARQGATLGDGEAPAATLEVRRSLDLVGTVPWNDPIEVLGSRAGVERVEVSGRSGGQPELVRIEHVDGRAIELKLSGGDDGWRADLHAGDWPITTIEMTGDPVHHELVYRVTLGADVDPLAPGLRGRLAFDLTSDLITLSRDITDLR